MKKQCTVEDIKALAKAIRKDILAMTMHSGPYRGHVGGALSCADILAVLYGAVMNISSARPEDPSRDRFLLSKGHVALAQYAALAECGFFPKEELQNFQVSGSDFPTHTVRNQMKGIETSSGSLGYGLSIGVGCALSAKMKGEDYHTYVLLGDGECNEGSVWEAAMSAVHFQLDNLTMLVDVNGQQSDGYSEDIMPIHDIVTALRGLGFYVLDVDGHDVEQLLEAVQKRTPNQPTAVIARTVKGKGIALMENQVGWHHAGISQEQYDAFIEELEARQ